MIWRQSTPRGTMAERLAAVTGARLTPEELEYLQRRHDAGDHAGQRLLLLWGIARQRAPGAG